MENAMQKNFFRWLTDNYQQHPLKHWRFIATLSALLLVQIPAPAASTPLVNGGVISAEISVPEEQDTYTFTANADESVQIRVADINSGKLAPRVSLYGPDGSLITARTGSNVAWIDCPSSLCEITESDTYSVVVADGTSGHQQVGSYNIYFVRLPGANEGGNLLNGDVISDQIDLGDLDSYTFVADAGASVQIRVTDTSSNGKLAPRVFLYGPDGSLITAKTGSSVAQINCPSSSCEITESGTHSVVIADGTSGHQQTGSYSLEFEIE